MGSIVIRVRVLPKDAEVNASKLIESVSRGIPSGTQVLSAREDPVAFGIVAAVFDIQAEEAEGVVDAIEGSILSSKFVGQLEVLGVSRARAKVT